MNKPACFIALLILSLGAILHAEPPKVVKATPDNGAKDVDPNLTQIEIVFDQPMNPGGRSIVGGGESFPEMAGQPKWTNDHTMLIPVKLMPDHDYWLSINNPTFRNFKSVKGESAAPYPIGFTTAGGAKIAPEVQKKSVQQLREAIDKNYSYRDLRKIDWDKLFADNSAKLEKCETARAFAQQAGEMLAVTKDIHMWLKAGSATYAAGRRSVPANIYKQIGTIVPNWHDAGGGAYTGKYDDGITYVMISNWSKDLAGKLDPVFTAIGEADAAKGIIIDVRANSGGDELVARQVAGCFVGEPKVYSKNTSIEDGKWLGPFDRVVEPNKARPAYRGKVAVLIGKYCMSSNESFILMMKSAGASLVGERTFGSSGNPKPHELANGVTLFLPSWKDMLPDGSMLEGVGVAPDVEVKAGPADFEKGDPVLDKALAVLRAR